jgi:dihydrodipicolinate synthase/N-acetylneuraminate lyase
MNGQLDCFSTSISGLGNVSPSVLHAIMEHMKVSDRQTIQNLQHNVEHRSIVELLMILEDAQCPNYML